MFCDFLMTFIFKNDVNVPSKSNKQKDRIKNDFSLTPLKIVYENNRIRIRIQSISQSYGSAESAPYQNFRDPQHWRELLWIC